MSRSLLRHGPTAPRLFRDERKYTRARALVAIGMMGRGCGGHRLTGDARATTLRHLKWTFHYGNAPRSSPRTREHAPITTLKVAGRAPVPSRLAGRYLATLGQRTWRRKETIPLEGQTTVNKEETTALQGEGELTTIPDSTQTGTSIWVRFWLPSGVFWAPLKPFCSPKCSRWAVLGEPFCVSDAVGTLPRTREYKARARVTSSGFWLRYGHAPGPSP